MRADMQAMRADIQEIRGVVNQHTQTLAEHGRRLDDLTGQVKSLPEPVTSYHASVLGHGILLSELNARVRRIEHHLNLPPAA
jgi:transcriptional regulator of aromatic amino acid metabolism